MCVRCVWLCVCVCVRCVWLCVSVCACVNVCVYVRESVTRTLTDGKQYAVTTGTFVASSGAEASSTCPIYSISHTVLQAEQWMVCMVNSL